MNRQLVFVYNADSGLFNTVTDIAHKIFSPSTYSCQLCALTHSYFSVRDNWTSFIRELNADCEFMHRDEFVNKYGQSDVRLPVIYSLNEKNELTELASADMINACKSIDDLKKLICSIV